MQVYVLEDLKLSIAVTELHIIVDGKFESGEQTKLFSFFWHIYIQPVVSHFLDLPMIVIE